MMSDWLFLMVLVFLMVLGSVFFVDPSGFRKPCGTNDIRLVHGRICSRRPGSVTGIHGLSIDMRKEREICSRRRREGLLKR